MSADPLVRADNRCALESCGKLRTVTAQARQYAGKELDQDPFCSTACARAWHGTSLQPLKSGPPRVPAEAMHG